MSQDATNQLATFGVSASAATDTRTTIETRGFEFEVDEPKPLGGTDEAPNPVEYLLGAWAGCLNVVGHGVADEMDLEIDDLSIDIEGDLDPAKFLGEDPDVRAGYQHIEVTVDAEVDADDETVQEWLETVEKRCPVGDTVANPTPVDVSLSAD